MADRFCLTDTGIVWQVAAGETHTDELEMSGCGVDLFVRYGVDKDGRAAFRRHLVFPTLRLIPNHTLASFQLDIPDEAVPPLCVNGVPAEERAVSFAIDGLLIAETVFDGLAVRRQFFPAAEALAGIELVTVTNRGGKAVMLGTAAPAVSRCGRGRGTKGVYTVEVSHTLTEQPLQPGESTTYQVVYSARIVTQPPVAVDGERELALRLQRVRTLMGQVTLDSGDPVLDRLFAFSCLRGGESLFRTAGGLMHCPGGRDYYAATWCNDQVEYAAPWFAVTGDAPAVEATYTAFSQYEAFMDEEYQSIPSSVIAEGMDIWESVGDRGDAAMYLYGASAFALYKGDEEALRRLWKPIQWCAEYCRRRTGEWGVVESDTDELEGRFPTDGVANLSTSLLCLGGLRLAAQIAEHLGEAALGADYRRRADALEAAVERHFGAELHGYHTYRYSRGYDTLRGWICLPLVMGLTERREGTVAAMLSPYLWTEDGILSCEEGEENPNRTIWDRATLYGFKGLLLAGEVERIWEPLSRYCRNRLLGDRVPYAVEAWPEGDRRHLSGESTLFCRMIAEGLFGLKPVGWHRYAAEVQLPRCLPHLRLSGLRLGGHTVSIEADRSATRVWVDGVPAAEAPFGQSVEWTV